MSPGIGFLGERAVLGEEKFGACRPIGLAGAHMHDLHAARKLAGADPHEGDAVAVVRVHVGLHLEHEPGQRRLVAVPPCACRRLAARGGGASAPSASSNSPTPKFFSAQPKKTGVIWPSA